MQRLTLLCLALFLIPINSVPAESVPETTPPPAARLSEQNPGAFDPAVATTAWLETVPADKRAKSDAYFEGGYWLLLWNFLVSAAILLFLLQSRISAGLRDFAERITKFKALQVVAYAIPFILIVALLGFPLSLYSDFFREHKYGLATQTFLPWFGEQTLSLVLVLIFAPIALVILYVVFRRAPRTWWIWGTVVAVCLQIFGSFIAPVFVMPLFNKYTPLEDPIMREPILAMARANQIPVSQVFVVNASKQTTRISANVAGFYGTTRIALNDNLIKQCTLAEVRAVMAHEMGHYVLNHNGKLVMAQGILTLVIFALTARFFIAATDRWGNRWGIRGIGDPAGLPLLALIISVISFFLSPVANTIVRTSECEADAFGLNTAREPDAMAMVALKLGTYRKLNPTPLEEAIFFDHPSGRSRIRMAMDWKAARLPCGEIK